jgi:hypothetical protein
MDSAALLHPLTSADEPAREQKVEHERRRAQGRNPVRTQIAERER